MTLPIDASAFFHWIDAHNAFDPPTYLGCVIAAAVFGALHCKQFPPLHERPGAWRIDGDTTVWRPSMFGC